MESVLQSDLKFVGR